MPDLLSAVLLEIQGVKTMLLEQELEITARQTGLKGCFGDIPLVILQKPGQVILLEDPDLLSFRLAKESSPIGVSRLVGKGKIQVLKFDLRAPG